MERWALSATDHVNKLPYREGTWHADGTVHKEKGPGNDSLLAGDPTTLR